MLTSQQVDTLQGIVCNYESYVVYNYSEYHDYSQNEVRDSRIVIYVGGKDDISYTGSTFSFSGNVQCFYLTYNKYMDLVPVSGNFSVPPSELVYTNLVPSYPDLCWTESKLQNADFSPLIISSILVYLSIHVVLKVIFGGKD